MIKNNKKWFTLVELIVVITILAILSTLGFVAYTDYLKWVRDSSRIQQMTEIHKALSLYGIKSKIPNPDNAVTVVSWSSSVWSQWYVSQSILDTVKYSDGWVDPKTKDFYTLFVSSDRKYAQILGYFEERNQNNLLSFQNSYADDLTNYRSLYPQVVGAELGVLIQEETNIPIHEVEEYTASWTFDILSATGGFISYATNTNISTWSGVSLIWMVPNINCKKILDVLGSAESKVYKINPTWEKQVDVYCDMETDGWWWTFAWHIDNDTRWNDIYFNVPTGEYNSSMEDTNRTYWLDLSNFFHSEMIMSFDNPDVVLSNNNNKFLQLKYDIWTDAFNMWPLMPWCTNMLGDSDGFYYKTTIDWDYNWSSSATCSSGFWSLRPTPHGGTYIVAFRDNVDWSWKWSGWRYDSRVWWITDTEDADYDVSWNHDIWIFVR